MNWEGALEGLAQGADRLAQQKIKEYDIEAEAARKRSFAELESTLMERRQLAVAQMQHGYGLQEIKARGVEQEKSDQANYDRSISQEKLDFAEKVAQKEQAVRLAGEESALKLGERYQDRARSKQQSLLKGALFSGEITPEEYEVRSKSLLPGAVQKSGQKPMSQRDMAVTMKEIRSSVAGKVDTLKAESETGIVESLRGYGVIESKSKTQNEKDLIDILEFEEAISTPGLNPELPPVLKEVQSRNAANKIAQGVDAEKVLEAIDASPAEGKAIKKRAEKLILDKKKTLDNKITGMDDKERSSALQSQRTKEKAKQLSGIDTDFQKTSEDFFKFLEEGDR